VPPPPPPQDSDGWPPALNESVDENGWPSTTAAAAATDNNKVVFDMQFISSIDENVTPTMTNLKKGLPNDDIDVASTMNAAAYISDTSDTDDDSADKNAKKSDPPSNRKKDPPSNIINESHNSSTPSDEDDELKVVKTSNDAELNTTDITMNTTITIDGDDDDMKNNSDYILDSVSVDSDPNNGKHHGGDNDLRFRMEMNPPPIAANMSGKGQSSKGGGKGGGGSGRHVAVISPDQSRRGRSSSTTRHNHRRGSSIGGGGGLLFEDEDYEDDIRQDDRKHHHRSQSARRHDRDSSGRRSNNRSRRGGGGLFSCGDFEEDITDTLALITQPMRNFRKLAPDDTKSLPKAIDVNSVKTDPAATAKGKRSAGGWQDENTGGWNLFCSALGIKIYQLDEEDGDDDFVCR
jgi:hypothetical protein